MSLSSHLGVPALVLTAAPNVLNLRDGVPHELLGKMIGIAWGLFGFVLVIGLLVEAFSGSPDQPKNYGGVAWRAVLVISLLTAYPKLFGTVISTAEGIATRVAPAEIWDAFNRHSMASVEAFARRQASSGENESSNAVGKQEEFSATKASAAYVTGFVGGGSFDTFVALIVSIAQAFQWAFLEFSQILLTLLYVLGPLAIVFHIPGHSQTAGRWFRAFVTIAVWPVISSLLLAIANSLMYRTNDTAVNGDYTSAFNAITYALLLVCLNVAVPLLASALVGGGVKNVILPAASAMFSGAAKAASIAGNVIRSSEAGSATALYASAHANDGSGAGSAPLGIYPKGDVAPPQQAERS